MLPVFMTLLCKVYFMRAVARQMRNSGVIDTK